MKRATLGLGAAALLAALAISRPVVRAADHIDGPSASADPSADITDVFAWMSPDSNEVYLVLDVVRAAGAGSRFSNQVQYVFHTTSHGGFGEPGGPEVNVICEFDAAQEVSCWVGNQAYVHGNASATTGLVSDDGRVKVFTGLRNDPFFFNLTGFKETAKLVEEAAPHLDFDAAGCPSLSPATAAALGRQLKTQAHGAPVRDDFANFNVLAIVVALDKTLLTTTGRTLSVWASTHRKA